MRVHTTCSALGASEDDGYRTQAPETSYMSTQMFTALLIPLVANIVVDPISVLSTLSAKLLPENTENEHQSHPGPHEAAHTFHLAKR